MAPSNSAEAGSVRFYLFNSLLHDRNASKPFVLNDSDGPALDYSLSKINGLVSWEFTAYYLRVVYWPLATETELLDLQIAQIVRERTAISHELFPYASDKTVDPYTVDEIRIIPAETLPGAEPREFADDELQEGLKEAGFDSDKFTKKVLESTPHRRVYDLCKNRYEHGDSAPIVELNNGEYDREAFRRLVAPLEEELTLLKGVLSARVAREQIEVTYRVGLDIELLDNFVSMAVHRFKAKTEDDMSIFCQLKKGAPTSLFIRPWQACAI